MRFKYYLRGAGLGILFSTIIMMVAFHTHGNHISEEEVVKRAGELGMVWADDEPAYVSDEIDTQTESQAEPQTESQAEPQTESQAQPEPQTESQAEPQTQAQANPEPQAETERQTMPNTAQQGETGQSVLPQANETDQAVASQEDDSIVTITVVKGEVCRTLAEDLAKAGLVADAEEFRVYMGDHNYASFIHVGEFEIPRGATYEEIAQILIE